MDEKLHAIIIAMFGSEEAFILFFKGNERMVLKVDAILKMFIRHDIDNKIKAGYTLAQLNKGRKHLVTERTYTRRRQEFGMSNHK